MLSLYFYFLKEVRDDGSSISVIGNYLSPGFQMATLIGGVAFVVMGVFLMATSRMSVTCGHDHSHDDDSCESHHHHGQLPTVISVLVIAIPVVFSAWNTKHRFSERELTRRTEVEVNPEALQKATYVPPTFSKASLDQYLQTNANGAYKLGMMEIFSTSNDPSVSEALEGERVEVSAAVRSMPGRETDRSVKRAYRLMMQCCAADMQAITMKMQLSSELADEYHYPEHTWLKMEAVLSYESDASGVTKAVLTVDRVEEVQRPDDEILLSDYKPTIEQQEEHEQHVPAE
jgi:uncharacterized repeat protein (TIGR03943 family)